MTAVKDIKIRIKTASAITSESFIRIKAKRALQCLFAAAADLEISTSNA